MHFFVREINGVLKGLETDHFFVMRIAVGQILKVFDFKGGVATVKILNIDKKLREIRYEVVEKKIVNPKSDEKVLIQAKTDKNYLEKMVEVAPLAGISKIIIFNSDRSEKLQKINLERLEKVLIRSCEQGEILFKPEIKLLDIPLKDILKTYLNPTVLDMLTSYPHVDKNYVKDLNNTVLVGPEGGWSDNERSLFRELNLPIYDMGDTVFPAWLAGYTYFLHKIEK